MTIVDLRTKNQLTEEIIARLWNQLETTVIEANEQLQAASQESRCVKIAGILLLKTAVQFLQLTVGPNAITTEAAETLAVDLFKKAFQDQLRKAVPDPEPFLAVVKSDEGHSSNV